MSRHWQYAGNGTWRNKSRIHARTTAWEAARARRQEQRKTVSWQNRSPDGFILKMGPDGVVVLYDPGEIDRYLYTRDERERQKSARG